MVWEVSVCYVCLSIISEFRRSSGIDLESDSSSTVSGEDKENLVSWRRSKSMDVLSDDGDTDVFTQQDETVPNKVDETCLTE